MMAIGMPYLVKEIYYTIQGEGAQAGRAAVFLRFAGCNLWSGKEEDRSRAVCNFCDTDFLGTNGPGGGVFHSAAELAQAVRQAWPEHTPEPSQPWVVCTGGEPLLQLDEPAIQALHAQQIRIAVETNGTLPVPADIDWLCVSPKAGAKLAVKQGDELKLVYPQPGVDPARFANYDFQHFFLQPMDGTQLAKNQRLVAEYCLQHPQWRVSLQLHKILGLP
jgi:7-carboxy-7-deazaguanine synthase (Cx14CxxC type)